jgi:hypothetical protein
MPVALILLKPFQILFFLLLAYLVEMRYQLQIMMRIIKKMYALEIKINIVNNNEKRRNL